MSQMIRIVVTSKTLRCCELLYVNIKSGNIGSYRPSFFISISFEQASTIFVYVGIVTSSPSTLFAAFINSRSVALGKANES